MKAVDTNVLVRFLIQDDEIQTQKVTQILSEAEKMKQPLFVSQTVVLELIWVLRSAYEVPRQDILLSISELLSMSALEFQDQQVVRDFVTASHDNTYDLSDLLISQVAKGGGCDTTLTFDKKAAKSPLFTEL
ncbi:PIN domain-containing protein [Leucothrix pacifica]|uniref:VapC toxin family PIN domain ribonuclease n=1 Tax=Leucothrix pacifica TaxID=1247513 RepID=A0A317C4D5_9GAMM|nr:type II toxin-antitoxin system VapC family toxin [Leucothrix pacifica]PWQ92233.1 VapC toxin family PIN domain ribonuclease [Leucothrix pacifica]